MATSAVAQRPQITGRFYVGMAWTFIAIAVGGFFETYWLQLARGTFVGGGPMLHLHGLLFTAWTLFFLSQTTKVANGHLRSHKSWGLLGISLATAMVFTGFGVAIEGLHHRLASGNSDPARAFTIVPLSAILCFAGFFAAAMLNLRRPEWHKRLMIVATAAVLQAAIARFLFLAATGGGPGLRPGLGPVPPIAATLMGGGIAALLIVAGMIHDWRSRGHVHAAYVWGLTITIAVDLLRVPISTTVAWYRITDFLLAF